MPTKKQDSSDEERLKEEKIEALQKMIANAEQTMSSAKQMLAKLQGTPRNAHLTSDENVGDGKIIYGNFDGQIMVGEDGKQYPVPANYASKSKLVEGDLLKLTITGDGNFVYKQVGPVERKYLIGFVKTDERGNYYVDAEGKKYKVLLAAATYFKIEAGDEVTLVVPRDQSPVWGAIENVLRKAEDINESEYEKMEDSAVETEEEPGMTEEAGSENSKESREEKIRISHENEDGNENEDVSEDAEDEEDVPMSAIERLQKEIEEERKKRYADSSDLVDEWMPDIDKIKKEAGHPAGVQSDQDQE